MPFQIIRDDITKVNADAIVNAANTMLKRGGGVCGAIFNAAGADKLRQECDGIGGCDTGKAIITPGFDLSARYIIHTVGPVWSGGQNGEAEQLYSCYIESLMLAKHKELESVAFPLISSGIFGYPKEDAFSTAIKAISDFLQLNEMMVYLVVYDKEALDVSEKRLYNVGKYIDDKYVEARLLNYRIRNAQANRKLESEPLFNEIILEEKCKASIGDFTEKLEDTFSESLLKLIDKKEFSDVETYNKANISRKLFSKIRINKNYQPSKITAVAFCIALELNMHETQELLGKAGYRLSRSYLFDVIVEYFIEEGIFNVYEINEVLFSYDQVLICA